MFPHRYPRPKPRSLVMSVLLLAALSMAAFASAQGNSGTIKVRDDIDVTDEPGQGDDNRNEPHVEGDVYIEGFNMAADEGLISFYSWPPTGDMELVLTDNWTADDGEPEFHFIAGPYFFDCGHYRVEVQNGMEEDDFPGGVKSKMFWVDCPDEPEEPEEPQEMLCPAGLAAVANEDGTITLTFEPAAGSDGTNVYQAVGDGDFEYIGTVPADVDTVVVEGTEPGTAYAFTVTALYGDEESTDCPVVEVTAIPVFPSIIAFGMAVVLGAGAYLALVVRRKA